MHSENSRRLLNRQSNENPISVITLCGSVFGKGAGGCCAHMSQAGTNAENISWITDQRKSIRQVIHDHVHVEPIIIK